MNIDAQNVIFEKYPNTDSQLLANELNISIYQLRRFVSNHKLKKSNAYKLLLIRKMHDGRDLSYESSRHNLHITDVQENILIGSLLGDGSLSCYGRSREALFREQGCIAQSDYRKWKAKMLSSLQLRFYENTQVAGVKSRSNALFSKYYHLFYVNGNKTITPEVLMLLSHPVGLLCLYLDDGSLVIDRYIRKKTIHLFPRITIYSQSFTEEENLLLKNHISSIFKVHFEFKKRKDGHGIVLQCNKRDDIIRFLDIINTCIDDELLKCMRYKYDLDYAMKRQSEKYKIKYPTHEIIIDRIS